MSDTIKEYRGIRGLMAAVLTQDTKEGLTYETPFYVAGTSELSKETASETESHYYDNMAAVVIDSVGADTVNVNVSAVPLSVIAKLTGQTYDEKTGTLIEDNSVAPYVALGYITEDTDGKEIYVWRYKGKFSRPGDTHSTKNDGTDANGQELTYTGVSTVKKFVSNKNRPAMAINCKAESCGKTEAEFFESVQLPDDIITEEQTNKVQG